MNTTFVRGLHRTQTQIATDLTDGQPLGQALTHQQKLHGGLGEACPSLTPFPPARSSHRGDKFSPPVLREISGEERSDGRETLPPRFCVLFPTPKFLFYTAEIFKKFPYLVPSFFDF